LSREYNKKQAQLKANYLEHIKKDHQIHYHEEFINRSARELDTIDFLNQWEVYQKLYGEITNQKMKIEGVDTSNLIDSLNFEKPGIAVFEDKAIANQIQNGVRNVNSYKPQQSPLPPSDALAEEQLSHQLKQQAFEKGQHILQLVKGNKHELKDEDANVSALMKEAQKKKDPDAVPLKD